MDSPAIRQLSFRLLERVGVELEYMIVDAETLNVRPIADELLRAAHSSPEFVSDVTRGPVTWSNELVAHVIELKTTDPIDPSRLAIVASDFARNVDDANTVLKRHGSCLLPTAMHPWMQPEAETKLWPHEYAEIYATFDRLFNCRRHGWANLQSMHLNLSFSGDEEFARLHAAVRMLLPLLPALAASSPFVEGRATGFADSRLEVYRTNSESTPAFAGRVIPEPVWSEQEYHDVILQPIAEEIARLGVTDVLEPGFTNSRGAIARFERGSLEIRLMDMQECPAADVTLASIVVDTLRQLLEQEHCSLEEQQAWPTERLEPILRHCIQHGDLAIISDPDYFRAFGITKPEEPKNAGAVWTHLMERTERRSSARGRANDLQQVYTRHGCLSRRILAKGCDSAAMHSTYHKLAKCLRGNELLT